MVLRKRCGNCGRYRPLIQHPEDKRKTSKGRNVVRFEIPDCPHCGAVPVVKKVFIDPGIFVDRNEKVFEGSEREFVDGGQKGWLKLNRIPNPRTPSRVLPG